MNRQELKEQLETYMCAHVDDCDMTYYWNTMCENVSDYERVIYDMSELDDVMYGKTPTEVLDSVDDDFSTSNNYFCGDIYGLKSFSDIYDIVDTDELIEYIIDNCVCFDDLDIQKLLDEYDESED